MDFNHENLKVWINFFIRRLFKKKRATPQFKIAMSEESEEKQPIKITFEELDHNVKMYGIPEGKIYMIGNTSVYVPTGMGIPVVSGN